MKTVHLSLELELTEDEGEVDLESAAVMVQRQVQRVLDNYIDHAMEDETCGGLENIHVRLTAGPSEEDIMEAIKRAALRGEPGEQVVTYPMMRRLLDLSPLNVARLLAHELQLNKNINQFHK